ncbi:MAG: PAS domain S-box protein, partial [Candidatus Thiodiazotropha taylori]|nr:PAS domain S-box protein [Candidatus Thiodiazotropha taylori]
MFDTFDFLKVVLDTITDHISVIDDQGTIIYVNKSWIEFGSSNGIPPSTEWVGVNYFDACAPREDPETMAVKSNIEAVINGKSSSYYHEYPCHSPLEDRWFLMRVNSLEFNGSRIVVIAHSNITERKDAEQQALHLSITDSLTGLSNRRHFDKFLTDEW